MKRDLLSSKISLKIRKRVLKICIWTKALYGCETWTVEPQERRRIEAFEMWCYRRMLGIKWEEHITNEEVLNRIGEKRSIWNYLTRRRDRLVGHIHRHPEVENMGGIILEGTVEGSRGRGRPRREYIEQIVADVGCTSYREMKVLAQDRVAWRTASNRSND